MTEGWKLVGEWKAIDCPEYLFEVEEYRCGKDQMVFVHLHVWKWSKTVFKRLKKDFALFRECIPGPIFTAGTNDDDKFLRFVSLFGWTPLTVIPCTDGKTRRLFIHIKKHKNTNVFQIKRADEHYQSECSDYPVGSAGELSDASLRDGARRTKQRV